VKPDIHPTYHMAKIHCGSCGTEWEVGSTRPELRVDVCSNCHPFFTGKATIIDTAGQVERFQKRLERHTRVAAAPAAPATSATPKAPEAPAAPAETPPAS
jgi:large subunit ribosomal protein L31